MYAEERLAERFLKLSWLAVLDEDNAGNRGNLFEAFVRVKFSQPVVLKIDRESLPYAPVNARANQKKNFVKSSQAIDLSSKRTIVRVAGPNESVKGSTNMDLLFYSKNESEELTDMIMRVVGGYLAVQVTIQKKHSASPDDMRSLVQALNLQHHERLTIIYVMPKSRLAAFETSPVNPLLEAPDLAENVVIYHMAIDDD